MIQQTSLFAYRNEVKPTLGARQKIIYEEIQKHEDVTNGEISASLHIPINTVTPRVNELRKLGMVVLAKTRKCRVTGRTCLSWKAV